MINFAFTSLRIAEATAKGAKSMADIILTNDNDSYSAMLTSSYTIYGKAGDDVVDVDTRYDGHAADEKINTTIYGGDGNDVLTISGYRSNGTIIGGSGDDMIRVDIRTIAGFADGGDGDDSVYSSGSAVGGAGNDYLDAVIEAHGGDGADHVSGGQYATGGNGDDYVTSGEGSNGGKGSDEIVGGDSGAGGDGNDVIYGSHIASGGRGHDVFIAYGSYYENMFVDDFEQGVDRFATGTPLTVVDSFTGHANEVLSKNLDVDLDGDGVADTGLSLFSPAGILQSDLLYASLLGGAGVDQKTGSSLAELMLGHDGNDKLGGAGGDDWLFGGFGDDTLSGDAGDDLLVGNAGSDTLKGGLGSDNLEGGDGNDTLSGNAGDDILAGSSGKDVLTGGAGKDTFVFHAGDSGIGGANRDVITDFESGLDKIQLVGAHSVSFNEVGGKALIGADMDGDGKSDLQISVGFGVGHSYADFSVADIIIA